MQKGGFEVSPSHFWLKGLIFIMVSFFILPVISLNDIGSLIILLSIPALGLWNVYYAYLAFRLKKSKEYENQPDSQDTPAPDPQSTPD